MFQEILLTIGGLGLVLATIHDLRTREVPDYLNYFLFSSAIAIRILWFLLGGGTKSVMWVPVSFAFLSIFAYTMYKGGQWGGGDVKLIMALSILFASLPMYEKSALPFFVDYFSNTLLSGGIYGIAGVSVLALINRDKIKEEIGGKKLLLLIGVIGISIISFLTLETIYAFLITLGAVGLVLASYFKVIEEKCMKRKIEPSNLTVGDWLDKEVKVEDEVVVPKRNIGLLEKDIEKLKELKSEGKIEKVQIKVGIPFIPSFLLSYVMTLTIGNGLIKLVKLLM